MKRVVFAMILFFISIYGYSQKVQVEFLKEGRKINLEDNFQIYFVFGDSLHKIIVKPKIDGNEFTIPNLLGMEEGRILFEYKKKVYNVGKRGVVFKQDMKWVFGFDKVPYAREYHSDSINEKEIKGVFYLEFHPLESGDGVVTAITFKNTRQYLRYSKAILYH